MDLFTRYLFGSNINLQACNDYNNNHLRPAIDRLTEGNWRLYQSQQQNVYAQQQHIARAWQLRWEEALNKFSEQKKQKKELTKCSKFLWIES